MIEESYVSFETAKLLKEAGFDVPCRGIYRTNRTGNSVFHEYDRKNTKNDLCWDSSDGFQYEYLAPTQALAARWLHEVYNLHVYAIQTNLPLTEPHTDKWEWGYIIAKIDDPNGGSVLNMNFPNYEAALEAGIVKCLELLRF